MKDRTWLCLTVSLAAFCFIAAPIEVLRFHANFSQFLQTMVGGGIMAVISVVLADRLEKAGGLS